MAVRGGHIEPVGARDHVPVGDQRVLVDREAEPVATPRQVRERTRASGGRRSARTSPARAAAGAYRGAPGDRARRRQFRGCDGRLSLGRRVGDEAAAGRRDGHAEQEREELAHRRPYRRSSACAFSFASSVCRRTSARTSASERTRLPGRAQPRGGRVQLARPCVQVVRPLDEEVVDDLRPYLHLLRPVLPVGGTTGVDDGEPGRRDHARREQDRQRGDEDQPAIEARTRRYLIVEVRRGVASGSLGTASVAAGGGSSSPSHAVSAPRLKGASGSASAPSPMSPNAVHERPRLVRRALVCAVAVPRLVHRRPGRCMPRAPRRSTPARMADCPIEVPLQLDGASADSAYALSAMSGGRIDRRTVEVFRGIVLYGVTAIVAGLLGWVIVVSRPRRAGRNSSPSVQRPTRRLREHEEVQHARDDRPEGQIDGKHQRHGSGWGELARKPYYVTRT